MNEKEARWRVSATLSNIGFHYVPGPDSDRYAGVINVGHKTVELDLTISDLTFAKIPIVRVKNPKSIPVEVVAHLEQGTGLCYGSQDFLRLDRYKPGESVLRVIEEAKATIEKSLSGNWKKEIESEFPLYWGGIRILIPINESSIPKNCFIYKPNPDTLKKSQYTLISKTPENASSLREVRSIHLDGPLAAHKGIVVPKTLGQLEKWLTQQVFVGKTTFATVVNILVKDKIVFLIAKNGTVGFSARIPKKWQSLRSSGRQTTAIKKLLLASKDKSELVRFHGVQCNLDFVTQRNSMRDHPTLKGKCIAVVGCGTIGSHLARLLIQSGAGHNANLLLIDNQDLSAGNLGRHLCNYSDIGLNKALALGKELSRFHPDVQVRSLEADLLDSWEAMANCDLIVDAVGIEDVGDFLNSKALLSRSNNKPISILHTWLVGNGIGAQAFLNVGNGSPCYRCLRPTIERSGRFDMRKNQAIDADVVMPSCGEGAYVPYLVDAPIRAACLALNAVHSFFSQEKYLNLTNDIFDSRKGKHIKDQTPSRSSICPACGN